MDINVLNEATHYGFIFEIREKKSSRKIWEWLIREN